MKWIAGPIAFTSMVLWASSPTSASDDLKSEFKQYYEQKGYPESWTAAVKDLNGKDEKKWKSAADKLVALLSQAKSDEFDGTSPWRATPFWGGGGENPARNLRKYLLRDLMEKPSPGALPVVRWYLFQEPIRGFQPAAMKVLKLISTPDANALRLELLKAQTENSWVVAEALRQTREQKLNVAEEMLAEFAKHHRPGSVPEKC